MKTKPMADAEYTLLLEAYDGSGGFKNGNYLTPHKRETADNYNTRKKLAFYLNYTKVVVNSHVNAVFQNEPDRTYKNNLLLFEKFIDDADGQGTSFNRWMKRTAQRAKLYGAMLIVVDNFREQPDDLETAIKQRALPYVYAISPKRITDWETDRIGRLTSITYSENCKNSRGQTEVHYRTWTTEQSTLCTQKGATVETIDHNLGILPCMLLYGQDTDPSQVIPESEFLQVAKTNQAIFNLCSEIRELQRHQGFNVLTVQGNPPTNKKTALGSDNALYYDPGVSNAPNFIAPDPSPLEKLESFLDRLIGEIYRMACVTHTQQYANANQSGESKKWAFQITRQVLNDFATSCEYTEMRIGEIFGAYVRKDLDLQVSYNRKYGIETILEDLQQAMDAIDLNLGTVGNAEIRKRAARQYFAEYPDDEINKITDAIDAEKTTDLQGSRADNMIDQFINSLDGDNA